MMHGMITSELTQTTDSESGSTWSGGRSSESGAIWGAVARPVRTRCRVAGVILEADDCEEWQNFEKIKKMK